MGRTIEEQELHDGSIAYTVTRDVRTRLRNFIAALSGLAVWILIAGLSNLASGSKYAWILLIPGVLTFAWLIYTLALRRVGIIVRQNDVLVRSYVGVTKLTRENICAVVVRTQEPVERAKLHENDEKHYLAIDTVDGGTTICFFDMKFQVLCDVQNRIENVLC